VNGQSNRSNLFLLDGVNNEGSFGGTYAVAPIVDDIQEFKVQTHNDDASFGGVMGGVVNVVTKSGTSHFHGSGWEFLRNKAVDANIVYPAVRCPSLESIKRRHFSSSATKAFEGMPPPPTNTSYPPRRN
jgi:hypothetical protein